MRRKNNESVMLWCFRWQPLLILLASFLFLTSCGGGGGGVPSFLLKIILNGNGTVTSNPAGINCTTGNQGTCQKTFSQGTQVTLTANPATGYQFGSWAGCDSANGNQCTVTMNANKNVTATFTQITHQVSVSINPSGAGTVTSNPQGIDCPTTCQANFPEGSTVTLTANANTGYLFDSWNGCDSVNGNQCTLNITGAKNVTANFVQAYTLTVQKSGNGTGTVTSDPAGINCGSDCSEVYATGKQVTLTAQPDASSRFDGWSGDCSGTNPTVQVTMDADKTCTATFSLETLQVSGDVKWDNGNPVAGAEVLVRTQDGSVQKTSATDNQGRYTVGISPPSSQVIIVRGQTTVSGVLISSFKRSPQAYSSGSLNMDPVILPSLEGAQLTCGGSSCQNADGSVQFHNLPNNVANMWARSYDPESNPEAFPGEFGEANGPILSNVFVWGAATDAQGNSIGAIDPPATARIKIAPVQWPYLFDAQPNQNNGIQVPIYFFNEDTGQWEFQGATGVLTDANGNIIPESQNPAIVGGTYEGDVFAQFPVNHLSWWNVDYPPPVCGDDFGDADDPPYPSLSSSGGPRHSNCPAKFWLGRWLDTEPDSRQPDADFYDDSITSRDPLKIRVSNYSWSGTFYLNAFIDKNQNGSWESSSDEWVLQNFPVNIPIRKGKTLEPPEIPSIFWPHNTWLRVMVTERALSGPGDWGPFQAGETEDFLILVHRLFVETLGSGKVTSKPPGIDCGSDCWEDYPEGTQVTLTAQPDPGRSFLRWDGDCQSWGSNPTCPLSMDSDKSAVAIFQTRLNVGISGQGKVNVNPPNADCTASSQPCTYLYDPTLPPMVTLTATPDPGWEFVSWQGGCSPVSGNQCTVWMGSDQNVTAIFRYTLLQITTTSPLPDAFVGQAYTAYIDATNGLKPYSWSRVSGTGDGWLTFTQEGDRYKLTGTPTATGQASFRVRVQDSSTPQQSDEKDFVINILQAGGQDLLLRFRDRCGNALQGVWAYLTEPRTEEQLSTPGGTVLFTNVTVPYTVTWGYDDGNPDTQDRLETARITDSSVRDITLTIDDAPPTPCPNEGSATATISGNVTAGQPLDTGQVFSTLPNAGGDPIFSLPNDPNYSLLIVSLPDDGTPVPLALGAGALDPFNPSVYQCSRYGLLRNLSIKKNDNLTEQDIPLSYNCTRDETGTFFFPSDFTQFHLGQDYSALNLSPEGGSLPAFARFQQSNTPQPVPSTFTIRLPSGISYGAEDKYQYYFQYAYTENDRGTPDGSDDISKGVWLQYLKPAGDPVGNVQFLSLVNPQAPVDSATGVPVTVPFQWYYSNPNDPDIVFVDIEIDCPAASSVSGPSQTLCLEPGAPVWNVHLQGTQSSAFTLPDLSGTTQKPASLGLARDTLYYWNINTVYFDLNAFLQGTDPEKQPVVKGSGWRGWRFTTAP